MKPDITSRNLNLSSKMKPIWGVAGLMLLLCFGTAQAREKAETTRFLMSPQQLQKLPHDQRVILDTRSRFQYMWGHVPGAVFAGGWMDYSLDDRERRGQLNRDKTFLAKKLNAIGASPEKTLVIYGDPKDKWREDGRFFWMFEFLGFKKVYLLDRGLEGWTAAGLPVERGPGGDSKPGNLTPQDIRFDLDTAADQDWIRQRLEQTDLAIIDNRETDEFHGATPYGSKRGGHIPKARHIDWRDFFDTEGQLKPVNILTTLLEKHRIRPGMEIVVYCTGGVRSAMAYFVFRTLGYKVRNYDGSWWDWSHNPALPVETS